jgi:L-alanine-DL-glutamate epimerase-like enolase superfamily enzyme
MNKPTDVRPIAAEIYFLPVQTRMPVKFGPETLSYVTVARAKVTVTDRDGRRAVGWGETPLSVQWVWPSKQPFEPRHDLMKRFTGLVAEKWVNFETFGHPVEISHDFQHQVLPKLSEDFSRENEVGGESLSYLGALLCCSVIDQGIHDAYGILHGVDVYETYGPEFMSRDLAAFLTPADGANVEFRGKFIADYLVKHPPKKLRAWHLVGGVDPLLPADLNGSEPRDGYPVLLKDWVQTDGLKCLKVKLRGNDAAWDYDRLVTVGRIGLENGVDWLTADFNCTVNDPAYVDQILDRLRDREPRLYGQVLYVEQPFPYELEKYPIDVRSVSARKPLFLDESAHDWQFVKLGRSLGWSGVALKTCKTQSGALLSLCWAKAHGMPLMVQDLTNPMLAMVSHARLAAHAGTIMGVETNGPQYYPEASAPEAAVHPGLYRRRDGDVDLSTIRGPGFGYRANEIHRKLPEASFVVRASQA